MILFFKYVESIVLQSSRILATKASTPKIGSFPFPFHMTPQVFNRIYVRAAAWPVCPLNLVLTQPFLHFSCSAAWSTVLQEIRTVVLPVELQHVVMKHLHILITIHGRICV